MILLYPIWLLLAIPLALALWLLKPASRFLRVLRIFIVVLILLAMCYLSVELPSRRGTVVVVADRSLSMPADAEKKQKEAIDLIQAEMSGEDDLAVISFGQQVVIERFPQSGKFPGFTADVDKDASNLATAVQTAISIVPHGTPGRILVLSDGKWTGSDPVTVSSVAAARGISVDYRLIERPTTKDLSIYRLSTPENVSPGESFMITVWIQSPFQQEVSYRLNRGPNTIAIGTKVVSSGLTRLTFRDRASGPGTIQYQFSILADPDDPIPENNTARMLVGVTGQKSLLCVIDNPQSGFADLIRKGQVEVEALPPESCNWALEDLSNYSAVILEDIPAGDIGIKGMQNIAAWVKETGSGFMMTGGKNSYGPGGYFKSPLEPIMPVSMELRKEHRKLSIAIVVALDRSGSMSVAVSGGKRKMDLANLASVQVLDLLSPMDEFGVIAVDSQAHKIVDLGPVSKNINYRDKILSINSQGGGIFVYEALSNAASMLASATPQTKHIILFADAADSEQPGQYIELLRHCQEAGITVSVVGLGKQSDVDAGFLEDVATRGNGRIFFTESAEDLPRLFAQDTFAVARSTFLDEPTPVDVTSGLISLTGRQFEITRTIGGYNLCYLRPNASLAAVAVDEYTAPIVAAWQAGIGRALCYTGQVDGPYTGEIARWQDFGNFFTSIARWVVGGFSELGPDMLLTNEVWPGGAYMIKLYLNPERENQSLFDLPKVTALSEIPGKAPQTKRATMQFQDADTLTVEIPISGSETILSTVEVEGFDPVTLTPVCLAYSPEFQPATDQLGQAPLSALAKATGGSERTVNLTGIWDDLPKQPQMISIGPWLLLGAIVLLLLEVFERRTGLLTNNKLIKSLGRIKIIPKIPADKRRPKSVKIQEVTVPKAEKTTPEKPDKVTRQKEHTTDSDLLKALSKAQRSAKARTDRK